MKTSKAHRIALLFNANKTFDREVISGVAAYLSSRRTTWELFLEEDFRLRLGGIEHWHGRRLVGRFQVCAVCTCCGGPHGMCIPAPCCYAINCNIPNRPFGVCSFTPRTCNCLNCHL